MIFLIEYKKVEGRIVTFKAFDPSEQTKAQNLRLDLELDLNRKGVEHEVILLEAASEEALHQTHRRYFESLSQIVKSANV